jgi:N-acetylgalactosamine-N,N'-diacetylbacillosaminyl-diphospho-undecaprenol 4-alpha-N-acetylgalactosaminyltransferase
MIAILVNSLARGGAERVALTLIKEMKQSGHKVLLICLEHEDKYSKPEGIELIYLTDNNKITNPLRKIFWLILSAFQLSKLVKRRNIEIIQSHLIRSNIINIAAKLLGAQHSTQIVTHTDPMAKKGFLITWIKGLFISWFYNKADQIVSISEVMKANLEKYFKLNDDKLDHVVINNPHNIAEIQQLAQDTVDSFYFDPSVKYLISAGRLLPFKHVDHTIIALNNIRKIDPSVELLILGSGEEKGSLEKLVKELNLEHFVHFLGQQDNPFSFIARSTVLVLSSATEGLPNILVESLGCGTPVVSSDCVSGPREILSPISNWKTTLKDRIEYAEYGILYPVHDTTLLTEAILKLLNDESLRKQYIWKGLNYVTKYDKKRITQQYIEKFRPGKVKKLQSSI